MRWLLLLAAVVYVLLLAASHLVRGHQAPRGLPPHLQVARLDENVRLAYRDAGRAAPGESPILLLHGSPGSSRDFSTLQPALAGQFRAIAPDLPGFGYSSRRVPDYSIRAHARYALRLLDHLEIERVHVVGFSMGGGVALEMTRLAPHRTRSVTLLSAIGMQELELLGDYRLNHAIHGLQLGLLTLLHEGLPHFGALDDSLLGIPYARNFFDSDQRPLRQALEQLDVPTLVVHGTRDVLVPVAAAREHHRLVPQSELELFESSHFMIFRNGAALAAPIGSFLERVEDGTAASRDDAAPARLEAAALPFSPADLPAAGGLALVILMLLLAVATFASEDLASIGTGLLVAQGRIGFVAGVVACIAGILIGDIAIYLGGKLLGRPWLRRAPVRWVLTPSAVERSRAWFSRRGPSIIFASRFLPGTRVATYFAAGLLSTGFWRFLIYLAAAVVLWVPLIVGVAALLGSRVFAIFDSFSRFALPGVLAMALVGWLGFRTARALLTHRGRRLLVGRWRRWRRWEFWPRWLFYPPVILHVLRLGLGHRRLTAFTAANPVIPAAGFVGESKSAILSGLDPGVVARYRTIAPSASAAERLESITRFMEDLGLAYPVVLKPDVGERGTGVLIASSTEAVQQYLVDNSRTLLVQEYVAGVELGVFYARRPDEERGRILSLTEKRLPEVVGDGTATLEKLILEDERAVSIAPVYLDGLAAELERIPGAGEIVRLVEVGTHCRGALFLDGRRFHTPALDSWVDAVSCAFKGFFFGRYDLRAPSFEAFGRGEEIQVVELNGVTSEATHIYDPGNSLGEAYRVLFRQWELAFEIGHLNADAGAPVTPVPELLRMLWRHWRS